MRLTVVGCAPAWTRRPGRASSCYLVEHDGRAIVLDLGQGAFSALAQFRLPDTIDAVVISHLHADHLVDLIPLRHFLTYDTKPAEPIAMHGPAELRSRIDAFHAHEGFLDCLTGDALAPGTFEVAGFNIEARHVTHIPDSYAFRITTGGGDPGLVYSGDCAVADDLLPLVRPGDVLLSEAALGAHPKAEETIHLTAAEAASVAQRGSAQRLILTHVQDKSNEGDALRAALEVFNGPTFVAAPGMVVEVA